MEGMITFVALSLAASAFLIYVLFNLHRERIFLAKSSAAGSKRVCVGSFEAEPTLGSEHQGNPAASCSRSTSRCSVRRPERKVFLRNERRQSSFGR
jgi:hypothetical protein